MSAIQITVAGFTGMFARLITSKLLSKPNVTIHGICRNPDKVPQSVKDNSQVKIFVADSFDQSSLEPALKGSNVCICCYSGDTKLIVDGQRILIDACIAAGVPRYVASDFSFDFRGLKMGEFPFKDFQLKTRDYLDTKEKEGAITAVHPLNGAFMEAVLSPFFNLVDVEKHVFHYWGSGDEPFDLTKMEDAAAFVAEVACDKDAKGYPEVRADKLTAKDMAKTYEKVYGHKVTLDNLGTFEDLEKAMHKAREEHPDDITKWLGMYYHYFTTNGATLLKGSDINPYPGLHLTTFEELLSQNDASKLPGMMTGA